MSNAKTYMPVTKVTCSYSHDYVCVDDNGLVAFEEVVAGGEATNRVGIDAFRLGHDKDGNVNTIKVYTCSGGELYLYDDPRGCAELWKYIQETGMDNYELPTACVCRECISKMEQ